MPMSYSLANPRGNLIQYVRLLMVSLLYLVTFQ
jgi:hypothetical protein